MSKKNSEQITHIEGQHILTLLTSNTFFYLKKYFFDFNKDYFMLII